MDEDDFKLLSTALKVKHGETETEKLLAASLLAELVINGFKKLDEHFSSGKPRLSLVPAPPKEAEDACW